MKKINSIYIGLAVACILGACVDDTFVDTSNEPLVEEGIPMTIDLAFQVEKPMVQTRAAASVTAENTVQNLYVFAFNSDGSLDGKKFYNDANADEWSTTNQKHEETDNNTTGTISNFEMTSGNDKTFYAVANVGYSGVTENMFNDVTSKEQLLEKTFSLVQAANIQRTFFVMTGQVGRQTGGAWDYTYNIDAGQNSLEGKLYLKRTDARITFNVTARNDNNYTDFSFVPKNYRVFNIPRASYLFEKIGENGNGIDAEGDFDNLPITLSFDTQEIGAGVTSTFDFYVQENRQPYQRQITQEAKAEYDENANATLFAMREKREMNKPDNLNDRAFIFAPQHGTYVEIQGVLSYQKQEEGNTEFISADVTYTIHLGNTGSANDANDVDKVNNYETLRNTHYTYNVTITDINSIIVEVEDDNEERPGAEGDVVIAGGEVVELDAHFDRYRFILWRDDLAATTPEGMLTWAVSTPFENAMRIKDGPTASMPHDYKWITFAINKEYNENISNSSREFYVKYPGDDIYDGYGNATPTETGTYKTPHWNGYDIPSANMNQVALRDIEQLLNFLSDKAQNEPNSDLFESFYDSSTRRDRYGVAVTAFIDEFVYINDPMNPDPSSTPENPSSEGLLLWKKVVNGSDRLLHICRGVGNESSDGASSVIRSVLSFRQHPIYTIYDTDSDVETAWGTESIIETGPLAASFEHLHTEPYTNTPDNGRQNQMNFVIDTQKDWDEIISQNERYGLKHEYGGTNYNTIWHACMLRNRDINGDNRIDSREVRWYLAAIDQLSDLWTGDASINESARAYPNEEYRRRYHIASSTYWDAQKSQNPTVMWAEEGGSIGQYSYSKDFNATGPGDDKPSDQYAYRCVRNLGIPLSTSEKIPDDYVQWNPSTRVIDLTRLGYASKRSAYDGGNNLDEHNERDESNKPYVKFQIATEQSYYQSGRQDLSLSWNQFNVRLYPDDWWVDAENPCPKGYRVPNQRELGIMLTIPELKNELSANGNTITNTGFSMNGEGGGLYSKGDRPGFLYVGAEGTFILDTDTYNANGDYSTTDKKGGTRCVRDVTN